LSGISLLLLFEPFRRNTFGGGVSGPYPNKRMTCTRVILLVASKEGKR
jgi:hypothetical protein